jgi:hypothetical protein
MPDLEYIAIWTELDMEVVERCGDQAECQRKFKNFVEFLFDEEGALLIRSEDEDLELSTRIDCNLWVPLYEMNKNYHSPRRRHLKQGVAPLAGLPEWGYSMFHVNDPLDGPFDNSFIHYGEELTFLRIEYRLPVPDRMEIQSQSPSEFDYEFDESGWATSNAAGWS